MQRDVFRTLKTHQRLTFSNVNKGHTIRTNTTQRKALKMTHVFQNNTQTFFKPQAVQFFERLSPMNKSFSTKQLVRLHLDKAWLIVLNYVPFRF